MPDCPAHSLFLCTSLTLAFRAIFMFHVDKTKYLIEIEQNWADWVAWSEGVASIGLRESPGLHPAGSTMPRVRNTACWFLLPVEWGERPELCPLGSEVEMRAREIKGVGGSSCGFYSPLVGQVKSKISGHALCVSCPQTISYTFPPRGFLVNLVWWGI